MSAATRREHPLLDSLRQSLLAAAEIGANRVLGLDEAALAHCRELQGRCIELDITDIDFQVYCHPGSWGIRLGASPPARAADATIAGHLMALVGLATDDDKVSSSIRGRVNYHGDVALAQKLQKIVVDLDIDWEEVLARQTGDVLAVQLVRGARQLRDWFGHSADSLLRTSSEYLREEAGLSPTQIEFDLFQARNTELRHDVARAEARLERLLDRAASR